MDPVSDSNLWAKVTDKALDKLPVEKIYDDLLQPGIKKLGTALGDIVDIVTLPITAGHFLYKKGTILLDHNLRQFEKKLLESNEVPIKIPAALGVPIIEKLSYISDNEIAEAFLNLLTKASFPGTIHQVHPAFASILSNLSTDEAKMLFALRNVLLVPTINSEVPVVNHENQRITHMVTHYGAWDKFGKLEFQQNVRLYISNFMRLGLLEGKYSQVGKRLELNAPYDKEHKKLEDSLLQEVTETYKSISGKLSISTGFVHFTDFGDSFVTACMKGINES